jgi:AraC family transcriptional regulator of arabinose operon
MWWADFEALVASHQVRCQAVLDKYFDGYWTLQLMNRGSVTIGYDDDIRSYEGAWIWPHGPGPRVRLHASRPGGWWEHRHVAFRGPIVESWIEAGLWPAGPQQVRDVAALIELFDGFRTALYDSSPWQNGLLANVVERILLLVAEERDRSQVPTWLHTVQSRLRQGQVDAFDARALAQEVGMGASTLRRRFRQATGRSLRDWALATRLQHAARLLQDSDHAISAIADELGYCDAAAFSRQFKQHFGLTPRAYRALRL